MPCLTLRHFVPSLGLACALEAAPPQPIAFPLEAGFEWVYRAQVSWTEPDHQPREKELQWRIRVLEVRRRKSQVIARIEGWLEDLAWYEPGKKPGNHVLVYDAKRGLHLLEDSTAQALWNRLGAAPKESVSEAELEKSERLLPAEISEGLVWGDSESLARNDSMYVRRVEETGTQGLDALGGWSGRKRAPFFRIAYRTNPDHSLMDFVPGLGFTSFTYVHHGTVSGCEMKLVAVERKKVAPTGMPYGNTVGN